MQLPGLWGFGTGLRQYQRLSKKAIKQSSAPAKAALITGVYILLAGVALLFAPLRTFTLLFDQRSIAPVWIRVGGILCCLFGSYYLGAAHGDMTRRGLRSFYEATITGRVFLFAAFSALVLLRKAQPQLMILALINLIGAASMGRALMQ